MHEKQEIRSYRDGMGIIRLRHLANPHSVKVLVGDEEIKPISFNYFGSPIFSKYQKEHFELLQKDYQRKTRSAYSKLEFDVEYDEMPLDFSRDEIDTINGISTYLGSVSDLTDLLLKRTLYVKEFGKIDSWVLWGRYWLTPEGTLFFISSHERSDLFPMFNEVEPGEHYFNVMNGDIVLTRVGMPENIKCPYCGKNLTIEDIKNYNLVQVNDSLLFHQECREKFETEKRLGALLEIMDTAYAYQYTYEQVEDNPYPLFNKKNISIKCKTPDGTIQLTDNVFSTRVIFGSDYPQFDIKEVTRKHSVYINADERRIGSPKQSVISAILKNIKNSLTKPNDVSDK